ncbi:MAG: hypothetical protein M1821_009991 [Bathelium mastoideum]|nr:MAG: hypothetical protein M1821_009991 [Bathelium mastoideum]KAI9690239.1 MAG: hypothetical protein M1822_009200 [Bathelium mastoideum]
MDGDEQPRKRMKLSDPEDDIHSGQSLVQINHDEQEREARVGIKQFVVTDVPGFTGIFKQRYTDFLVNEILPNGEVVHLRKVEHPLGEKAHQDQHEDEEGGKESMKQIQEKRLSGEGGEQPMTTKNGENSTPGQEILNAKSGEDDFQLNTDDSELLNSIFGEQTTQATVALYRKVLKHPDWKTRDFPSVTSPPLTDRALRTKAHQTLRRIFESRLESSTNGADGFIKIVAASQPNAYSHTRSAPTHTADGKPIRTQGKGSLAWQQLGGDNLHFTLAKANKDTMEVVNFIASQLKLSSKHFHFAGTKDRRGVTVQRVSGHRVHRDALAKLNKRLYSARVGDFEYKVHGLDLGDLGGNEFTITLRDCHVAGEDDLDYGRRAEKLHQIVGQRVKEFEEKGWINQYGLQRFGSFVHGTETIGLKILQGDFEAAIALLLSYNKDHLGHDNSTQKDLVSSDDLRRAEGLHIWETEQNSRRASEKLPRRFSAESAIIKHLGFHDKTGQMSRVRDFQGALGQIPKNLRLMYVHAYQSLVWNAVAGKRIEMFGTEVVAGDLVIVGEKEKELHNNQSNGQTKEEMEVDEAGEVIIKPTSGDSAGSAAGSFIRARSLSQQEAESGKFSIFDIVLPLPGFDVEYPANAIGAFYKEFMGSEKGGGLDPYDMRRKWKDISLSGSYRKLMARPLTRVEWEVRKYRGMDEQLVETELEKFMDRPDKSEEKATNNAEGSDEKIEGIEKHVDQEIEEDRLAVVFKLQLGASQYATMALRELTKGGARSFKPEYSSVR